MDKFPDTDPPPLSDRFWADYGNDFSAVPRPLTRRDVALRCLAYFLIVVVANGVGVAVWALGPTTFPPLALASAAALAGLVTGGGGFTFLTWWRNRGKPRRPGEAEPPMYILYGPPPEPPDPTALPFEERLLFLCKGDRQLLDRLVERERRRHPFSRRADLVRLAIQHFHRDLK